MRLLSTEEAAQRLGVISERVRQFIKAGRLPAMLIAGRYVIKEKDLEKVAVRKTGRPRGSYKDRPKGSSKMRQAS